jgi:uncharacterized membrane protein
VDLIYFDAGEDQSKKKGLKKTRKPNSLLSLILRGGVILSASLIGLGLLLFLATGKSGYALDYPNSISSPSQAYLIFHNDQVDTQLYFPDSPVTIWKGVTSLKPFALIMLGLLILIATPILNVGLATFGFFQQRDWVFSLISLFVLTVLGLSFVLAGI